LLNELVMLLALPPEVVDAPYRQLGDSGSRAGDRIIAMPASGLSCKRMLVNLRCHIVFASKKLDLQRTHPEAFEVGSRCYLLPLKFIH
jgi:hypothetical protein